MTYADKNMLSHAWQCCWGEAIQDKNNKAFARKQTLKGEKFTERWRCVSIVNAVFCLETQGPMVMVDHG